MDEQAHPHTRTHAIRYSFQFKGYTIRPCACSATRSERYRNTHILTVDQYLTRVLCISCAYETTALMKMSTIMTGAHSPRFEGTPFSDSSRNVRTPPRLDCVRERSTRSSNKTMTDNDKTYRLLLCCWVLPLVGKCFNIPNVLFWRENNYSKCTNNWFCITTASQQLLCNEVLCRAT